MFSSHKWLCLIFLWSAMTRLYKIDRPAYVCWDETHFGKMAGSYLNRTFFFDVHPPLGKLIIAFTGHCFGYDGKYAFSQPGDSFVQENATFSVPYTQMRAVCSLFGSMVIPTIFEIVHTLTGNLYGATISSTLLIFDSGLVTLSQYILLDPLLLFFITFSIMCVMKMTACQGIHSGLMHHQGKENRSFSAIWWTWMLLAGVSLGCALSTKFVGAFTILYVGIWTLQDLWNLLDYAVNIPISVFLSHFMARVLGLILVPLFVYILTFWIHFKILCYSGSGEEFYSSPFQASLEGNPLHNTHMPEHISSGSLITLRSSSLDSIFLHSHDHIYPADVHRKGLQQITGYAMRDVNNLWSITKEPYNETSFIKYGDVVHLTHVKTKARLAIVLNGHRKWSVAALSNRHMLVTAIKDHQIPFGSDQWRVVLPSVKELDRKYPQRLCSLDCSFNLVNIATGCLLHSSVKTLPGWGGNQKEITCVNEQRFHERSCWFVESVMSREVNSTLKRLPSMSFYSKFLEAHRVMLSLNSKLVARQGDRKSSPWKWPFLLEGQLFSKPSDRVYLHGTPIVWLMNVIALPLFCVICICAAVLHARHRNSKEIPKSGDSDQNNFVIVSELSDNNSVWFQSVRQTCKTYRWLLIAFFVHYFPFFLMSRALFFHHYFPAHVFACALTGALLNFLFERFAQIVSGLLHLRSHNVYHTVLVIALSLVLHSFYARVDLCYGV